MQASKIKVGSFYTTFRGETVRITECLPKTQRLNVYKAFEREGQEPIHVSSKELVAEVADPAYNERVYQISKAEYDLRQCAEQLQAEHEHHLAELDQEDELAANCSCSRGGSAMHCECQG